MAVKSPTKSAAAAAGGKNCGKDRSARLTPERRSESVRKAVQARAGIKDSSDSALLALLEELEAATDEPDVRRLSDQIERVIFQKQFEETAAG